MESRWNAAVNNVLGVFHKEECLWNDALASMSEDVICDLLVFVIFSWLRTKRQIAGIESAVRDMGSDFDAWCRGNGHSSAIASDLEESLRDYDLVKAIFQAMDGVLIRLLDMEMVFIHNATSRSFITSDSPVVLHNPYLIRKGHESGYGLGSVGLQVLFSIALTSAYASMTQRSICLMGSSYASL